MQLLIVQFPFCLLSTQNLDLVLLYLRIVHCIDFYNANEYHYEDEMPMRCGIMHVRAQPLVSGNKKDGVFRLQLRRGIPWVA